MITGPDAARVLAAIKSLDRISEHASIALVEAELMGLPVHCLMVAEHQPFGSEGVAVSMQPIAVLCGDNIAKRLTIGGQLAESASAPMFMAPEGKA